MFKLVSIFVVAALCLTGIPGAAARQTPESIADSAYTPLDAEKIALEKAGLEEVTHVWVEPDVDDGRPAYEVEIREGDWEYEYTVDAQTGAILEADKDYDPKPTKPDPKPEPTPKPAPEPAKTLTAAEAKAIALAKAGVAEADAIRLRAELDIDDGRKEWEIEFYVGRWEYDFEIDAETGVILDWEKEID